MQVKRQAIDVRRCFSRHRPTMQFEFQPANMILYFAYVIIAGVTRTDWIVYQIHSSHSFLLDILIRIFFQIAKYWKHLSIVCSIVFVPEESGKTQVLNTVCVCLDNIMRIFVRNVHNNCLTLCWLVLAKVTQFNMKWLKWSKYFLLESILCYCIWSNSSCVDQLMHIYFIDAHHVVT